MQIVICDPEEVYQIAITQMVKKWQKVNEKTLLQITTVRSSEDLLELIENGKHFDVIFLATTFLNELSGIDTARNIRVHNDNVQIVFLCERATFAMQGYLVNALRCLCKPIFPEQLFECLDTAFAQWGVRLNPDMVLHSVNRQTVLVSQKDIVFIESCGNILTIHRTQHKEPVAIRMSLSHISDLLVKGLFVRCHRSYIVNLFHVSNTSHCDVTLIGGQVIPIGRKCKNNFLSCINAYLKSKRQTALPNP